MSDLRDCARGPRVRLTSGITPRALRTQRSRLLPCNDRPTLILVARDSSPLGTLIRRLRKERDLSQEQLGELTGIFFTRISQIELGANTTPETLLKLAQALRARPDEVREMFRLAGFADLFDFIAGAGRMIAGDVPTLDFAIESAADLDSGAKQTLHAVVKAVRAAAEVTRGAGEASDARLLRNEEPEVEAGP